MARAIENLQLLVVCEYATIHLARDLAGDHAEAGVDATPVAERLATLKDREIRRLGVPDEMLPAVAQGAIGVERRADDPRAEAMLAAIHHAPTGQQLTAERAYLLHLDGSCETPIAGLAVLEGDNLWLRGEILRPDGSKAVRGDLRGTIADAADIGRTLAADLLGRAGPGFFA